MRIIDAHIHYFNDSYFDQIARAAGHENSESHLREVYTASHIRHAVVMGNRDLDLSLHQYPDFMSYCVGLDSQYFKGENIREGANMVEQHLRQDNCVGIKLYPGYNPYYVYDSLYHPYYELARAYKKPVAIHTGQTATSQALLKYSHPLTVDEVAAAFPDVQFVMCHFGNPWLVDAAAVLSKNPNVAADLSGLLEGMVDIPALFRNNSGYAEQLRIWMSYVGDYSRFLYGTDWPLTNIPGYIEFIARLVPERYHDLVFYQNAKRIYRLDSEQQEV